MAWNPEPTAIDLPPRFYLEEEEDLLYLKCGDGLSTDTDEVVAMFNVTSVEREEVERRAWEIYREMKPWGV